MDLRTTNELCRLLSDATRVRLVALLEEQPLSVAELTLVTGLAQSRVSTHLGKLREAGLVQARRSGAASLYGAREAAMPEDARRIWRALRGSIEDPLLQGDLERAAAVVRQRERAGSWADAVAGHMERHYSPGRTWESTARSFLGLTRLGAVLDIASGDGVLAALLAPRASQLTCLDMSEQVVSAGEARLGHLPHVRFVRADMHELPFPDGAFDQVLLMNALTYARAPEQVLSEAARVLRPGGALVGTTLAPHEHEETVAAYDHLCLGFPPATLFAWLVAAGLTPTVCDITHEERKAPHFKVITIHADKSTGDNQP